MKQTMSGYLVLCILLLMSCVVQAQSTIVKGKVTDENGAAVSSASIRLKNSKKGTVSGEDGIFSIQTNGKSTIVVSALGYLPKEIPVTGTDDLLITITKSDVALNEVVVTALGVRREKRNLTFSSQEIKSEDLVRSKEPNLINAIAGKVAGVQVTSSSGTPGASSRIVIRGITSIFGNNEALIVLDGIPIDNSETGAVNAGPGSNRLVDIDPSIIENVNVLKGAAATALYGSAGARGVVIITTKTGAGNKKPLISLSSDLSMENGLFPQIQSKYSQGDRRVIDGITYDAQYYNGEDLKTSSSWGALLDTLKVNGQPVEKHNQLKEFFNTGITSNTTLGIGGSTGAGSSYYISYSYFDQKGIVPTTDFKRHSFFSKYTTKISDKITSTFQLNYANSQSNRLPEGYNLEAPVWTIFTAPISYNLKPYLNADGSQRLYRFSRNNPYWVLDNIYTHGTVNRFLPVVTLSYNPLKWLTVTERVGADIYSEQIKYYEATGSSANAKGVIVDRFSNFRQFNHDLIIQGRKQFGNFDVDLLIGNNILSTYSQSSQARGVGLSIGGAFDNVSNASTQTYSEGHYLTRKVGFYSQANIEYKRILNLAITSRYDGSSVLSKDKSFYPYGSVAAGFIFSELIKNKSSFFNFGKLRLSYATVGNDNVGAYSLNTPFYSANTGGISFPYQGQSGFLLSSTLGNPQLKNELAKEFEIGLETKMFNSRIGLEVSYFNKKIEDGIIPGVTIAPSTGYTGTTVNSARLQTKGIEVLLTASIVKSGKFSWDATLNFTKLNNKVLALASDLQQIGVGFTQAIVGQPYGVKFGSRYARTASGELLIDAGGLPFADADQGIVGNISPDWMGGISNNIRYGQFSLNFFFDVKKGGDIENNVDGYGYFYGTPKVTEDRGLRVVQGISTVDNKPNTIAVKGQDYYRRLNTMLEPVIQDGSYIKLRNVSISYNIKTSVLAKTPFKSAAITFTGRNLWIYAPHFTGGDPEVSSFGSSNGAQGIYSFSTPTSRSLNCSLKFTF
ncbi:MAG: SusC/RagA family TonB-linked outer membrane protein [Ferruginibacter sp.]